MADHILPDDDGKGFTIASIGEDIQFVDLPQAECNYNFAMKYSYENYPIHPKGFDHGTPGIASVEGRHLTIMTKIERSLKPWNWEHYATNRKEDFTPLIDAFMNAKQRVENHSC